MFFFGNDTAFRPDAFSDMAFRHNASSEDDLANQSSPVSLAPTIVDIWLVPVNEDETRLAMDVIRDENENSGSGFRFGGAPTNLFGAQGPIDRPIPPTFGFGGSSTVARSDTTPSYRCQLCGPRFPIPAWERETHARDRHHLNLVRQLHQERSNRIGKFMNAEQIKKEMVQFGEPEPLKLLLHDYTFGNTVTFGNVKALSNWYKEQTPVVMLELVLWRAACFLNPPRDFSDMHTFFAYGGWKDSKEANRRNPLIGVVIVNVLPFLGLENSKRPA